MSKPLRLGIAGLGTVGVGVVKIVQKHSTNESNILAERSGHAIEISAVSARSQKDRGVDLSGYAWENNADDLAVRDDVDVYVELIGGDEGIALTSVKAALNAGKHVITANKALLAHHGTELALLAEKNGVNLRLEAAVAGGIPIIKTLTEGLAANQITRIMGVMNGTCNYILTRMETAHLPYESVFQEASDLGYLEADPNLDVGGIDAAHKLVLLASIAFGTQVEFDAVELEGIQRISIVDIEHVAEMGYRIKLLGLAEMTKDGLAQSMRPCLVPNTSPLAALEGGTNMVVIEGDSVGEIVMRGAGAGEGPTASAIMGDVMDVARGISLPVFGTPADRLLKATTIHSNADSEFYIRLDIKDETGAMATLSSAMADSGISINRMHQKSHEDDDAAPVIIVTHKTDQDTVSKAVKNVSATGICASDPVVIRILET